MFWLTVIIIYILILLIIIITIAFIILLITITILYCYYSHHYYCSQYYQCYLFYFYLILFLIVHITMTFACVVRVCVCILSYFFPFLVNDLHFILAIIVYIIIVIITIILFFSTLPNIGREFSKWIRAAWSTPTHWLLWVSRRLSIIFVFIIIFLVSYFLVTTVEVLTPSFIFITWHHLIMMPSRQGM